MYNGLTTADKGALLDAKARGAKWVARDKSIVLGGFKHEPARKTVVLPNGIAATTDWDDPEEDFWIELDDCLLSFITWRTEPVNIDLALAQIAEMESAEKSIDNGCEFCKHFGKPSSVVWDLHVLKMSGKDAPYKPFIKIELHARKNEAELIATSQGDDNKQNKTTVSIRFCPMCGRNLASPYAEGETV